MADAESHNQQNADAPGSDEQGAPDRKLTPEQIRVAARTAAQGIRMGKSSTDIVARLRQAGLTYDEAAGIEDHARIAYQHSQLRIGTMLMVSGVIWGFGAMAFMTLQTDVQSATKASYLLLVAGIIQILYGWQKRTKALTIRPMVEQDADR